ncbi:MAG: hypothetical protein ATN35_03430 [Epulopiscium sp. Nele67-Bin004]|nr:MAG: hypothetical protein ATN35_03430 [Epulopiscium sp. Nele67-Bin004]
MVEQAEHQFTLKFEYDENIDEGERQAEQDLKRLYNQAEKGDIEAQLICAKRAETDRKLVEQCSWYCKAAHAGNAEAQKQLGDCYLYGIGTTEDKQKAIHWYKKAVKQNHLDAQFELAEIYFNTYKLEKNSAGGPLLSILPIASFFMEGINITFTIAMCVGMIIVEKNGRKRRLKNPNDDIWEMLELYHKVAEQGHTAASERLVYIYKLQEN